MGSPGRRGDKAASRRIRRRFRTGAKDSPLAAERPRKRPRVEPDIDNYLRTISSPACFLNVDLEIISRSALEPLVNALGRRVLTLYLGPEFELNKAVLEISGQANSPDSCILNFCKLIRSLPPRERALWNAAKSRTFDIGIEAPEPGRTYWSPISAKAVRAAAEVNARIAISVYNANKPDSSQAS